MDALSLTGRVDDSGRFLHGEAAKLAAWLKASAGKVVTITAKVGRSKASAAQFRWYRGIALPILAEHLGYDKDEYDDLHDSVLGQCYGWKKDKLTGRDIPAHRTRENDTKEMSEFGEWFQRWCAKKHGVVIPDPQKVAA